MNKVKERPMLFSAPMVQATLDDRKTMTRRVVKNDVEGDNCTVIKKPSVSRINVRDPRFLQVCPHGQIGDRIWVRETTTEEFMGSTSFTRYVADGRVVPIEWSYSKTTRPSIFMPRNLSRILLEIINVRVERLHDISVEDAIAEGIGFDVVDQAVFFNNYMSESTFADDDFCNLDDKDAPIKSYLSLWESINGLESLESNPFVWVVVFKVLEVRT